MQQRKIIKKQHGTSLLAFFISGVSLMISSVVLLINLREFEASSSQYTNVVLIFMIAFTILGFVLLMVGVFLAIKAYSKKIDIDEEYITSTPQTSGLRVIRPSSQRSDEVLQKEVIVKKAKPVEQTVEIVKTQKKEPVKEEKKPAKAEETIPTDFTYEDGIQSIVDRYNTEKVKKAFKGWYNTMMITFPDITKSFLFVIKGDEGLDLSEGVDDEAAVKVKMDSSVFIKMMTKQINPIKAYSGGLLEVGGEMKNMLKLRKLMF